MHKYLYLLVLFFGCSTAGVISEIYMSKPFKDIDQYGFLKDAKVLSIDTLGRGSEAIIRVRYREKK